MQEAAAGVLGCTEIWKRGNQSVKPAASLLGLIAALDDLPVAQMLSKSWEKSELGEQPACLASGGICLLPRHPLNNLLLALHVTLSDSLLVAPTAATHEIEEGWHAGRICSVLRTGTCWGLCATALAVRVALSPWSPYSMQTCHWLPAVQGYTRQVQGLQLLCDGSHAGSGCPELVSTCSSDPATLQPAACSLLTECWLCRWGQGMWGPEGQQLCGGCHGSGCAERNGVHL